MWSGFRIQTEVPWVNIPMSASDNLVGSMEPRPSLQPNIDPSRHALYEHQKSYFLHASNFRSHCHSIHVHRRLDSIPVKERSLPRWTSVHHILLLWLLHYLHDHYRGSSFWSICQLERCLLQRLPNENNERRCRLESPGYQKAILQTRRQDLCP